MIYDCFTFFNELDLLEIRLNVLKDVVDKFVLVEADRTFTNSPKQLFYEANKSRFSEFADRIIHVVVTDHPQFKSPWHYESHQRNAIMRGLIDAKPNDVILLGDVDEIPNPEAVVWNCGYDGISIFNQTYYAYYLNYENVRQQWWHGTKMMSYARFSHVFDGVDTIENEMLPVELNQGTTPSKIRMRAAPRRLCKTKVIKHGGWHFTSCGGAEVLAAKMRSFSHQEYNPGEDKIDVAALEKMIADGKGPFWEMHCYAVPLDESFPAYICENRAKYSHLIYEITPEYMRSHCFERLVHSFRGRIIGFAERACPPSFHNALHRAKLWLRRDSRK